MLEALGVAARLHHGQVPGQVRAFVGERVLDAVANAGLGGEVDHALDPVVLDDLGDRGGVGDVEPVEREAVQPVEGPQPGLLERGIIIIIDDVDADHGVAEAQQTVGCRMTDETSCARNENWRAINILFRQDFLPQDRCRPTSWLTRSIDHSLQCSNGAVAWRQKFALHNNPVAAQKRRTRSSNDAGVEDAGAEPC